MCVAVRILDVNAVLILRLAAVFPNQDVDQDQLERELAEQVAASDASPRAKGLSQSPSELMYWRLALPGCSFRIGGRVPSRPPRSGDTVMNSSWT